MLKRLDMSVVLIEPDLDLTPLVIDAIEDYTARVGRAPRVVLALSDAELRTTLADELHLDGFAVTEVANAQGLNAAVQRAVQWPATQGVDLFIADAELEGCSPLHAFGYARARGLDSAAILLTDESDPRRTEADRLQLDLCSRAHAMEAIERTLLRVFQRRWSSPPVAA